MDLIHAIKAVGPILRNALKSGQLFNPQAKLTEAHPDVLCEYDVKIPMSEGFSVTANVYRSRKAAEQGEKVPVVMCAHPYDNRLTPALGKTPLKGPPQQYRLIPQAGGQPVFSKLTSWESPDPNFWIPAGYAVVNMNLPGYASSDGPPSAGESLQLIVAPDEIISSPPYKKSTACNHGKHVSHFGGRYDSYLLIPVIPQSTVPR